MRNVTTNHIKPYYHVRVANLETHPPGVICMIELWGYLSPFVTGVPSTTNPILLWKAIFKVRLLCVFVSTMSSVEESKM
jgi:hypothetical protein